MADLTRDDVLKLAKLAKLQLADEEADRLVKELSQILNYVEQLAEADVTGHKPTAQVTGLTNVTRADVVKDYGYQPADLLEQVPAVEDGQIKVKRMLNG